MMDQIIAIENERGEPREIPRDVDIQGQYTVTALRRYVAGVEGVLEARERARVEWEKEGEAGRAGVAVWVGGGGQVLGRVEEEGTEGVGSPEKDGLSVRSLEEQLLFDELPREPTPEEPEPERRSGTPIMSLPTELRELIYRPFLVSPTPTVVHNAWTTLYRRQGPRTLQPSILRVCRLFYAEGMRILYGENRFEYRVRDTTAAEATLDVEGAPAENGEGGNDSDAEYNNEEPDVQAPEGTTEHSINIHRHGPLMRYLTISAEANRSGQEYLRTAAHAISVFATLSPIRARVHTLRLDVQSTYNPETNEFSFADWFTPETKLMRALIRLPCRFVEFVILTPAGREVKIGVDREYGAAVRRARRVRDKVGEKERKKREERARSEFEVLMGVAKRVTVEGWADRLAELDGAMMEDSGSEVEEEVEE